MALELKEINETHLNAALQLTRQVKWPHRLEDWQQALRLGEGLVAEEEGALVGTLLYWRWGSDYATIGLLIVDNAYQGRGIGKRLMLAALEKLAGSNVRLQATAAGQPLYEKLGFVASGVVMQYQCRALPAVSVIPCAAHQHLRQAAIGDAALLTRLDRQTLGQYRPHLIADLLASAERVLVLEASGSAEGYACLRRFGHGYVIGPVVAGSLAGAMLLVSELMSGMDGQFIRIDTPDDCGLAPWLSELGMVEVDAPITMYRGKRWQGTASGMRLFGLMSHAMS